MAAEAEAARDARAKVIAAEGEQRASRALKEAADVSFKWREFTFFICDNDNYFIK